MGNACQAQKSVQISDEVVITPIVEIEETDAEKCQQVLLPTIHNAIKAYRESLEHDQIQRQYPDTDFSCSDVELLDVDGKRAKRRAMAKERAMKKRGQISMSKESEPQSQYTNGIQLINNSFYYEENDLQKYNQQLRGGALRDMYTKVTDNRESSISDFTRPSYNINTRESHLQQQSGIYSTNFTIGGANEYSTNQFGQFVPRHVAPVDMPSPIPEVPQVKLDVNRLNGLHVSGPTQKEIKYRRGTAHSGDCDF